MTAAPAAPSSQPAAWPAILRAALLLAAVALLGAQPVVLPIAEKWLAAQTATAAQDYTAAAQALAEVAARLPYSAQAQHRAGLAAISAERFDDAIRYLKAAAALDGWTATRHTALGDAYLAQGNLEAALAEWELALADLPNDDALLVRLANNYETAGRYADAVTTLNALAAVRPNDPTVFYRLAVLTAATAPNDAPPRLALVAAQSPDLAPAVQLLLDAIAAGQANGNPEVTFAKVGYAFEQLSEWRLAELALAQAVAINPNYADAYVYLGLAQDMQGKDGAPAYEQAVTLAPDSPVAQFYLGLHYRRTGDSQTALTYLLAAQQLDQANPAIAAEVGGAYAAIGDLTLAENWLTQAVTLDEQDVRWWLLLARFYVDNEYRVADFGLPAARQAVALAPDNAQALDNLGFALVLTGDLANGQKLLEQALALDPQAPSVYYHLGVLHSRQGQTADAELMLNHALALDPDGYYGGLALQALARLGQ
ncbi:MAG: tetratricopeptide repeat protein [Anaerolineales bacterium]|nr:tetratricopeptide repeat protein [Anaerolineales bacterium]